MMTSDEIKSSGVEIRGIESERKGEQESSIEVRLHHSACGHKKTKA